MTRKNMELLVKQARQEQDARMAKFEREHPVLIWIMDMIGKILALPLALTK